MSSVETSAEMARRLMDELDESSNSHYTKGEVKTILNAIAMRQTTTSENTVPVGRLSRGDVFIGKTIGGKQRPWVVLSVRKDRVCALALSASGPKSGVKVADKSRCRFWPDTWLTATLTVFNEEEARKHVSRPYTNKAHLREMEKLLGRIFGLPRPQKPRKRSAKLHVVKSA